MYALIWPMSLILVAMVAQAVIEPSGCDSDWRLQPITQTFNYADDVQPVWNQYCANCHVDHGGVPAAGLDLDPAFSYLNLVNAPNNTLSILLVSPGDPQGSLIFRKVNCIEPGPEMGDPRMPLGRPRLPPTQQALIHDWIAAGAPILLERLYASGFEER